MQCHHNAMAVIIHESTLKHQLIYKGVPGILQKTQHSGLHICYYMTVIHHKEFWLQPHLASAMNTDETWQGSLIGFSCIWITGYPFSISLYDIIISAIPKLIPKHQIWVIVNKSNSLYISITHIQTMALICNDTTDVHHNASWLQLHLAVVMNTDETWQRGLIWYAWIQIMEYAWYKIRVSLY